MGEGELVLLQDSGLAEQQITFIVWEINGGSNKRRRGLLEGGGEGT